MPGPSRAARERFLDAGLRVLADRGHAGLKLAAVCEETGTTTGSFYHAFAGWPDYTSTLIRYWRETKSDQLIARVREIPDPRERLRALVDVGLELPHASEAAIRVWAAHDPEVHAVQAEVDAERTRFIADSYATVIGDRSLAERYAATAMYLLIGHESGTAPSEDTLSWAFRTLLDQALGQL